MEVFRNIKYIFRKYPTPMAMSLLGLVLAFSAFMVISVQLDYEKGFDRFHPNAENNKIRKHILLSETVTMCFLLFV